MNKYGDKFLIEYAEYLAPDGERYPLFGGNKTLMSWEGLGVPGVKYTTDRAPFQHGVSVTDFRYNPRNVTFELYKSGLKRTNFYDSQARLTDVTRPNRSSESESGWIRVWLDDGAERETRAFLDVGPEGNWDGRSSRHPGDMMEMVRFFCPDPFWRDVTSTDVNFTVDPVEACLGDDLCFPFCIGTNTINASVDLTYSGTWNGDQVDIVLTGPINTPEIANVTTGKSIKLNYNVALGEAVTVSISPETVTIVSNTNGNLIGAVDSLSDLVDFNLVTSGTLTSTGVNTLSVSASGGSVGNTGITLNYYTRHLTVYGKGT